MLDLFNRLVVSILLVVLVVLLLAVAVTPQGVAAFFAGLLQQVQVDSISVEHLIVAAIAVVLAAICAFILSREWRSRRARAVPVTAGQTATTLATESVMAQLRHDVEQVDGVRQVSPIIHLRGNAVDILLEVRTEGGVDVPGKAAVIDQVARESLERLGVRLRRLQVKLNVARATPSQPSTNAP
jgi:hypothetical protein